jgi:hypothetical protein
MSSVSDGTNWCGTVTDNNAIRRGAGGSGEGAGCSTGGARGSGRGGTSGTTGLTEDWTVVQMALEPIIFQLLQLAGPVETVQVLGLLLPVKEPAAVPGLVLVELTVTLALLGVCGQGVMMSMDRYGGGGPVHNSGELLEDHTHVLLPRKVAENNKQIKVLRGERLFLQNRRGEVGVAAVVNQRGRRIMN